MKNTNEVAEIVGDLNECFFEASNEFDFTPFNLRFDGSCHVVEYMGISIWDDDNEPREFFEESDEYEPLRGFLLKRALRVHNLCALMFAPPQACA